MHFKGLFTQFSQRRVVWTFSLLILGLVLGLLATLFHPAIKPVKVLANDPLLKPYVEDLKNRVKNDLKGKVPEDYIEEVFSSPELAYLPNLMIKRLTWKETKLPYHQFLENQRIERARNFLQENLTFLEELEKIFGVDKEVIVGIFLVETNLGQNTGKFPVFNVFFSLTLSGNKDLLKNFVYDENLSLDDERNSNIIAKRSNWAYNELLYFLTICYQNKWDPFSIRGSIFGAFGYPQFVPKSYVIYGYDWDGDGKVDLFKMEDALASIANYLKKEGYNLNGTLEQKKSVIMKYNISEPYANTVLAIAEKLKKTDQEVSSQTEQKEQENKDEPKNR
ncbi:lytic murein transglycosylase [Thermodesulfobacterium sp. TA1]|uniref:lytic murein transglycosylase n=1 Tax=Thermodesulfobacterium sp. TA1 TaxID=2234087 RepID=UPI0012318C88|nr:lytic murein transglycosylase [Thermodesulfobacterium sp. TA1]QER42436.1 lytic murein transglycosylase [Thermodesulfobacterium sp. TA1]